LAESRGHLFPVGHLAVRPADLHVRDHRQDAAAQFGLKAVHHRQHDDQRRHAQRDAEHRNQRNEGNEMIAPFRPRIAQADHQFVGKPSGARIQFGLKKTLWYTSGLPRTPVAVNLLRRRARRAEQGLRPSP
jgi:hypothetical protein